MRKEIDAARSLLWALMLLLMLPGLGLAQERGPLPGERIRIRLSEQPRAIEGAAQPQILRGSLVALTADTLLLRIHPEAGITAVARAGIERLDISRGVRSRLESAAVNGATFALFGSVERVLAATVVSERYDDETTWESALIGAAGGALIGVTMGALFPQERWKRLRSW